MRRNVRFWAKYTWESIAAIVCGLAGLLVLTLFGSSYEDVLALLRRRPLFLFAASCLTLFMMNTGTQALYLPLLVSMGETRRNVYIGYNLCRLAILLSTLALGGLLMAVTPGEAAGGIGLGSLPTVAALLLAASSLGGIVGTTFLKIKWLGTVFIVLMCGGLGGMVGFLFSGGSVGVDKAAAWAAGALASLPWQLALAAGVLLCVDLVFHWLVLRRREVKL